MVKLLLDAIDEVRRRECSNLSGRAKKALKKTRFALLRNRTPKDKEAIARVQRSNRRLARAYELRVSFEDFWDIEDEEEARHFLKIWTR